MKHLKSILVIAIISFVAISCSDNNDTVIEPTSTPKQIKNFYAPQKTNYTVSPPVTSGEFIKFSFKEGKAVTGDNWDIAFRGTRILVNGGTTIGGITEESVRTKNASIALVSNTFDKVETVPSDSEFKQDASGSYALPWGSNKGWYTYLGLPSHKIEPIAGKVIVVKTIDGNYAKMEIKNYYKDMDSSNSADPKNSGSQYYTFDYVYNSKVGDKSLK